MSDERSEDEILGRALSRAIETQDVRETPYERSRLAVHPLRRALPVWQLLGAAAVLVIAVAFGAWLTRPSTTIPVAASPTPTATSTPSAPAVATPTTAPLQPLWVYLTRDSLPPIGANVNAPVPGPRVEDRILARIAALHDAQPTNLPSGTNDPLAQVGRAASGSYSYGVAAKIDADLATIAFQVPNGWGVHGAAQSQQLVQQIVYTVTEEPSIRRVLIVEDGKARATIDQLTVDKPFTRDDVSDYTTHAQIGSTTFGGDDKPGTAIGATLVSREIEDGTLVRLTFEGRDRAANDAKANLPTIKVAFEQNTGSVPHNLGDGAQPAYVLTVGFQWNGTFSSGGVGHVERVDRSPLRLIAGDFNTFYQLGLDDARPWRAYMPDAAHLVLEIGGDPRAVSDRIALYAPVPSATISRTFTVPGAARVFEATVVWRVRDSTQKEVANGHTLATLGSSELWGTFSTQITLPAAVTGNVTLEVYEVSMKDGSEQGVVAIPLTVR